MSSTGSPRDKWGIPFFYTTAENAGVTSKGEGFFWQQRNDIFIDNKNGMVRLGKEQDDVEVINSTTGEFEFPFASGADYFCLEVRQGHKSGGEEHGCEGSCYIFNVLINQTPAKFFFQKQLFHGGSKYIDPKTGTFGHSKVTEKVIGNSWKGFAAVIYNKNDGRSTGHDSAILEIWYNEDPVNHLKDGWFMVKRTEDKGGWGSGGTTCEGVNDQVITWSNIQFRYKSGTPDFSLHPLIPEFEDGPVIHSIGEEDMSFEDSEKRGYGKRADMPANVEMKCLFKFDSNNGICRLKNLSLREIDAFKAFDDTPDVPSPTEQPGQTQTIQGKFKIQWDYNTVRTSQCAGAGLSLFYSNPPTNTRRVGFTETPPTSDSDTLKKVAQQLMFSGYMSGKIVKQLEVPIYKEGNPTTPDIQARIWDASGTVIYTSPTTIDPSTLTTSYTTQTFSFSTNTRALVTGDKVGIEWAVTPSDTDYLIIGYDSGTASSDDYASWKGATGIWSTTGSRNFACNMYE